MKERPILFSGPMVRAILDGRKTQTRRLIRDARGAFWDHASWTPTVETTGIRWTTDGYESFMPLRCPYGVPGDRLWVRETHGIFGVDGRTVSVGFAERMPAGKTLAETDGGLDLVEVTADQAAWASERIDTERWRPSIFMPRWASRITLEVTAVRVERLQAISEADAKAEGVQIPVIPCDGECGCKTPKPGKVHALFHVGSPYEGPRDADSAYRVQFASLWDEINGKRAPWASNPFCWAISFRRVA